MDGGAVLFARATRGREGPRRGKDASWRVQGGRVRRFAQLRTIPPSPAKAVPNPRVEGREWKSGERGGLRCRFPCSRSPYDEAVVARRAHLKPITASLW